jgi:hypothetical protein
MRGPRPSRLCEESQLGIRRLVLRQSRQAAAIGGMGSAAPVYTWGSLLLAVGLRWSLGRGLAARAGGSRSRPKCSEVVTRCHLSVSDEANGIWSEDTACCQESRTFPSLTIFGKVPGCEASKNGDFALSSMRHRASFSGKSSRSRPDGTWWQLRYPWAIKGRSRVDTVIALGIGE